MEYALREYGKDHDRTILFIHGAGVSGWFWKKQIEYFSEEYHCLTVDLPGHGKSTHVPFTTLEEIAEDMIHIIKVRGQHGTAHVVGHSLGAKVAVYMIASKHASCIQSAVIASALFRDIPTIRWTASPWAVRLTESMMRNPRLMKLQALSFQFGDPDMKEAFIQESLNTPKGVLQKVMSEFVNTMELPEHLSGSKVPTLVLAGNKEVAAMRQTAADIARRMPDAQAILLKNCNHLYPFQKPQLFNEILHQWLKDNHIENAPSIELKYAPKKME